MTVNLAARAWGRTRELDEPSMTGEDSTRVLGQVDANSSAKGNLCHVHSGLGFL